MWYLCETGEIPTWDGLNGHFVSGDEVVFEKIIPRSADFNPIGLEVIGVIKYLCKQFNISPKGQVSAQLTGFRKWDLYDLKGFSTHERDAIGHGVVYLGVENVDRASVKAT